jgi:mRNA interferase RelE/StbE
LKKKRKKEPKDVVKKEIATYNKPVKWNIEFDKKALDEISALDKPVREIIISFLREKLPYMENPRSIGEALQGTLKGIWRYRKGDYRILCKIEDESITILVISAMHRRHVYK